MSLWSTWSTCLHTSHVHFMLVFPDHFSYCPVFLHVSMLYCMHLSFLITIGFPPGISLSTLFASFQMVLSLLSMLLLSALTLQVEAQSRTYRATDPSTGRSLECDRCPPGTYLLERCTSTRKTQCSTCPPGTFTELWNYIPKCLRCGACAENQVVKTACAPDTNCKCECTEGFYYKKNYDMCLRHKECGTGEGVLTKGRLLMRLQMWRCWGGITRTGSKRQRIESPVSTSV